MPRGPTRHCQFPFLTACHSLGFLPMQLATALQCGRPLPFTVVSRTQSARDFPCAQIRSCVTIKHTVKSTIRQAIHWACYMCHIIEHCFDIFLFHSIWYDRMTKSCALPCTLNRCRRAYSILHSIRPFSGYECIRPTSAGDCVGIVGLDLTCQVP